MDFVLRNTPKLSIKPHKARWLAFPALTHMRDLLKYRA